jgi:serine/threonine protein kinase
MTEGRDNSTTVLLSAQESAIPPGRALSGDEVDISIPGCSLMSVLSEDSRGKVFLAYQGIMGRFLVVRMLDKERCDPGWVMLCAPKLVAMNHPNAADFYDVIETEQWLYVLTEYLPENMSVAALVKRLGTFPAAVALRCVLDVARGLDYLQGREIGVWSLRPEHLFLFHEYPEQLRSSLLMFDEVENAMKINDYGLPCEGMEAKPLSENFHELAETAETMIGGIAMAPPPLRNIIGNLRDGKYEDAHALLRDVESLVIGKKARFLRWLFQRG